MNTNKKRNIYELVDLDVVDFNSVDSCKCIRYLGLLSSLRVGSELNYIDDKRVRVFAKIIHRYLRKYNGFADLISFVQTISKLFLSLCEDKDYRLFFRIRHVESSGKHSYTYARIDKYQSYFEDVEKS